MDEPVSVVMPVFNARRFVAEAVASVRAQGWPDLELIAIDDGSTDDTPEILATLAADPANRLRVVRTENRGPAAARNYALDLARGPFIAFIDADDRWPEGKLAAQMRRFAERPELEVVLGRIAIEDIPGFEGAAARIIRYDGPVIGNNLGAGVFRASAFARIGRFDEALRFGEDTDWVLRAIEAGLSILVIDQVTMIWRHHDANMTSDNAAVRRGTMTALKRSLDRRRSRQGGAANMPTLADFLERDEARA